MTAWPGHSNTYDSLDACLSDIAWYRPTDSSSKSYQQHLAIFLRHSELGLISRPPMFTVDDWDLLEEEWAAGSPIIFRSPRHYAQWVFLKGFFTKANILPIGHGLSELLYRRAPRKQAIICERSETSALRRYGTNRIHIALAVPALDAGTSSRVSKALDQIKADATLDQASINEQVVYCVRRSDLPAGHASITDGLCRELVESVAKCVSLRQEHLASMTTGLNPTGIAQWPADGADSIVLAANAFLMICSDIVGFAYIPGRGFLHGNGAEESSGGIYFWWDSESDFNSSDGDTILLSECSESIRTLRVSVRDWNRRNNRKAAIAAIMSRNMSHNLGSHALASSKFFASVGLLDKTSDTKFRKDDIQDARGRLQAFNQYCQGRLDFIARKLSEDEDKAEPMLLVNDLLKGFMTQQVLLDTLLDDNGFNTRNIRFVIHSAGKQDEWGYVEAENGSKHSTFGPPKSAEAVEDVLVGVTGGVTGCHALYALLENLLRNAAKYRKRDAAQSTTPALALHIEFLRSTVRGQECYRLRLWENLTDDRDDNGESPGKNAAAVRDGLSKDVVDEEGQPREGGHGMQEMRLCAEYLAGNDWAGKAFRFPSDKRVSEDGDDGLHKHDENYSAFLYRSRQRKTRKGDKEHKDLTKPALRAYSTANVPEGAGKSALVYELLLPNPLLLGLVCVRRHGDSMSIGTACKPQDPCVRCFPSISDMGKTSPHFGLIIAHDATPATIKATFAEVARVHAALPFRLLVVTPSDDDRATWQRAFDNASASPSRFYPAAKKDVEAAIQAFDPETGCGAPILPYRRLHVICNASFFPANPTRETHACPAVEEGDMCMRLQSVRKEVWQEIVLQVYVQWIEVWKGRPQEDGKWHLLIGFERDAGHVEKRWRKPLQSCECAKSLLDVTIASQARVADIEAAGHPISDDNGNRISYIKYFTRDPRQEKVLKAGEYKCMEWRSCLVFDNHGQAFLDIARDDLRFYHKFSGGEMTLYQLLETPPSERFAFSFYLLGLLEGCLANIATLDERVADAAIANRTLLMAEDDPLGLLRSSGIRPLFSFDRSPAVPTQDTVGEWMSIVRRRFITPNLNGWFEKALNDIARVSKNAKERIDREGIRFGLGSEVHSLREFNRDTATQRIEGVHGGKTPRHRLADAIVIHEGIVDSFVNDGRWEEGDHLQLYSLLPFVVRTSGRGRESRHLGQTLPFIELNVLSDSCYGSLNKIKLVKAILGASGELDTPEANNG